MCGSVVGGGECICLVIVCIGASQGVCHVREVYDVGLICILKASVRQREESFSHYSD